MDTITLFHRDRPEKTRLTANDPENLERQAKRGWFPGDSEPPVDETPKAKAPAKKAAAKKRAAKPKTKAKTAATK